MNQNIKLLLFDIDGTLMKMHKVNYWDEVCKKFFNIDIINRPSKRGKTDRRILKEFLEMNNFKVMKNNQQFEDALNPGIGEIIKDELSDKDIELIPGASSLLKHLDSEKYKERYILGLLTGNVSSKAQVKLEKAGLWNHFNVFAFGEMVENRSDLVPIALTDAKKKYGISFDKKDIFIIGDTYLDIKAAKDNGVRSIAVASSDDVSELKTQEPDYIIKDFTDIDAFMDMVG